MITYDEWFKIQSEIESRAREIWVMYGQVFEVWKYRDFDLVSISSEDGVKFERYYSGGEIDTEHLSAELLFIDNDILLTRLTEDKMRKEQEQQEIKQKQELARSKSIEESERKQLAILKAKYESKIN